MDDYTYHFDQIPSQSPKRVYAKGYDTVVQLDVLGLGTLFLVTTGTIAGEIPQTLRLLVLRSNLE